VTIFSRFTIVGANLPRRFHPPGGQEPTQRGDRGEARLWRLGTALAVSFTVAVAGPGRAGVPGRSVRVL